ncbi:uncharacterized protein LOC115620481 isoform X2 [Scaptodrosophila lebanonensis]|uniref:Uncharacterized protein LOC115620481 isoform X2 n=1 Tax=Drosophila lebanonensis TaxID=7225 RepID=A0A6J2T2Y1_DROLE|nr:uncharacterized protein LOC115620481 isoform X2 [Scaptodrosophila lebanonensis]
MAASPRQLEAIFIATPPSTPLSLTRTTTPRDLPTMYHFDFVPNTTESDTIEQRDPEAEAANAAPPPPLTKGPPVPEHGQSSFSELTPCPNCSRTFNLNALRKHVPICEKTSKKRNVFDSSRQRREGTTLATYVLPKNFGLPNAEKAAGVHSPTAITRAPEPSHSPTRSNDSPMPVRRKSTGNTELVRATVRASLRKAATTGEPSAPAAPVAPAAPAAPSAAPTPKSSFVRDRMRSSERSVALSKRHKDVACERCPHCERTFNAKAFDRHVEWCKEKAIQATIKLTGTTETNKAKERLEARKQYRPPNLKTKRSINRDKYSNAQDDLLDAGDMVASKDHSLMSLSSLTSSVHSDNGLNSNEKYDPFISAKRQLEELCSPTLFDDDVLSTTPTTPLAMSTSLTTPHTTSSSHVKPITPSTPKQPVSNFRRTSSLRGPRRTPLLPPRPLFSNYRPTIQRGLSDEGPISSNFLKPEEYDEMPVRAACGNDFHSPRVVRRDTSASNRKQQLKTHQGEDQKPESQQRNVAKTDSLAVFLKYEHELEQLNAKAAEAAEAASQLNSKELKDKSNILSKQNSAKSIKLEALTTPTSTSSQQPLPVLTPTTPKENNENQAYNYSTPLRLEPINSKPSTPALSKPTTPQQQHQLPLLSAATQQQQQQLTTVKLNSIFGASSRLERKLSNSGSDYIDPKLINPCDNLNMQSNASDDCSTQSSNESTVTPQRTKLPPATNTSLSQSSSQSTITQVCIEKRNSAEGRNLLKRKMRLGRNQFLYDASPEDEADCSSCCSADDEANRSSMEYDEQCWKQTSVKPEKPQLINNLNAGGVSPLMPIMPTFDDFDFEEFLSSFENDDEEQFPLFKDCREFLLNRTTSRQRSLPKATSTPNNQQHQQHTFNTNTPRILTTGIGRKLKDMTPSHLLFNIPSTKATTPTSYRSDSTVSSSCGSGSYKSTQGSGDEKLRRERSNASSCNSNENRNGKNNSDVGNQKKEIFISIETEPNAQGHSPISPDSLRQMVGNAQTPIEMVEIDNGNEPEHSKFSKISDTDDADGEIDDNMGAGQTRMAPSSIPATESYQQESPHDDLPNVQFNNAKNLIHQMQKEFRQLGEDASASMRKAMMIRSSATGEGYDMAPEQQEQQQQHQQQQAPTKSMLPQQQQQQQYHHQQHQQQTKAQSPLTPSGDSDELSSLDGYPISSSQSSRRGASSKLSSDSAYGSHSPYSLSRQRSSELSGTPRSQGSNSAGGGAGSQCMRPHTASGVVGNNATNNSNNMAATMMDASTQAHSGYGTLKMRQRLFGGSDLGNVDGHSETSSSGSENCLSVAGQQTNYNQQQPMQQQQQIQQQLHQQQQQMHQQQQQLHQQQQQLLMQPMQQPQAVYGSSSNNNYVLTEMNASSMNNNNGMHMVVTPTTSQHSLLSSASNTSMSSSMKMSKFCHECGAKFILEQAKFCMDCGVRRMIL